MNTAKSATALIAILLALLLFLAMRGQAQMSKSIPPGEKTRDFVTSVSVCFPKSPQRLDIENKTRSADSRGEALIKSGNLAGAFNAFQEALSYYPADPEALESLAEIYTTQGQLSEAAATYHRLMSPPQGTGYGQLVDPRVLIDYSLVLIQIGQVDEALSCYNRALGFFNYEDGKQHMKMLLPELGNGPGQMRYTLQRLQAMVEVTRGIDRENLYDEKEKEEHLREAVRLWPDSPVPYFYLAEHLQAMNRYDAAQEAFRQAFSRSSGQQIEVVRDALKQLPVTPEYAAEVTRRKAALTAAALAIRNNAALSSVAK